MTLKYEEVFVDEIAVLYGDDKPANPRATSLISKSVAPLSPWAAREAELQKLADIETAKVARDADIRHTEIIKKFGDAATQGPNGTSSRSAFHDYRKSLFDGTREPMGTVRPTPVIDLAYERVMAKAQATADRHEYPTPEQAFAALWNVELLEKRRSRAALPVPPNSEDTDDDSVSVDPGSGQPDNAEEASGMALSGHKGEPSASTQPSGQSRGTYEYSGTNTMVNDPSVSYGDGGKPKNRNKKPAKRDKLKKLKRRVKEAQLLKQLQIALRG
jgi:hypothetical protein